MTHDNHHARINESHVRRDRIRRLLSAEPEHLTADECKLSRELLQFRDAYGIYDRLTPDSGDFARDGDALHVRYEPASTPGNEKKFAGRLTEMRHETDGDSERIELYASSYGAGRVLVAERDGDTRVTISLHKTEADRDKTGQVVDRSPGRRVSAEGGVKGFHGVRKDRGDGDE